MKLYELPIEPRTAYADNAALVSHLIEQAERDYREAADNAVIGGAGYREQALLIRQTLQTLRQLRELIHR